MLSHYHLPEKYIISLCEKPMYLNIVFPTLKSVRKCQLYDINLKNSEELFA